MAAALLAAAGAALAGNPISCPGGSCPGTTGDDIMTGTPETDYIYADAGNDTLLGRGKFDDLRGQAGNDILNGGRGNDHYYYAETVWGEDRISGDRSGKRDWLIFFGASPLTIDLEGSPLRGEVSTDVSTINWSKKVVLEWVQAGPESDTVKGNGADNQLSGADGDDILVGRAGDDRLEGDIDVFSNVGNDTLKGGPGNDILDGGDGDDTILAKDGQRDEISCGDGTDTVKSDARDELTSDCSP